MRLACYLMLPAAATAAGPGEDVPTRARHAVAPGAGENAKADACPTLPGTGDCAKADARRTSPRGLRSGRGAGQRRAAMRTRV